MSIDDQIRQIESQLTKLRGQSIIGTYAIREDDTCTFLACDFDESSWQADILAFCETAKFLGIQTAIERSRSGKGGHAWIFFTEPVPARLARSLLIKK